MMEITKSDMQFRIEFREDLAPEHLVDSVADLASRRMDAPGRLVGLPDGRVQVVAREGDVLHKGIVTQALEKDFIHSNVRGSIGRQGSPHDAIVVESADLPSTGPEPVQSRFGAAKRGSIPMIVVGEAFTDEGVPIHYIHHREFPEVRGEGESLDQGIHRLVHHLSLALEHARSPWQRESIENAIRDVRDFHSNLAPMNRRDGAEQLLGQTIGSA